MIESLKLSLNAKWSRLSKDISNDDGRRSFSRIMRRRFAHLEWTKIILDQPVTSKAVANSRISRQMCLQLLYTMLITISLFSCRLEVESQHVSLRFQFTSTCCLSSENHFLLLLLLLFSWHVGVLGLSWK